MSLQDIEELKAHLSTYKEQLQQVKELLVVEPGNVEYQEMAKDLTEVIELTYNLLNVAQQAKEDATALEQQQHEAEAASTQRPPLHPSTAYKVHQDTNRTQNILGRLPVGTKVQAIWSEDDEWFLSNHYLWQEIVVHTHVVEQCIEWYGEYHHGEGTQH